MNAQFGDAYAQSVAKDFVFDQLGGRTVEHALADGVDAKVVWRAVCDTFKVPQNLHRGRSRAASSRKPDSGHARTISLTVRCAGPAGTS